MSRSGYVDYDGDDPLEEGRWRAAVRSALNGKRGQAALREIAAAMDAMPQRALIGESLVTAEGEYCTLGVLGCARGLDMHDIDPEDWDAVAKLFGIAPSMVREIVYQNDECEIEWDYVDVVICGPMPPYHFPPYGHKRHERTVRVPRDPEAISANRWKRMRAWVESSIKGHPND